MDFSKLRTGEIVASLSGIGLFVFLFFDWVGIDGSDAGDSGWDYLGGDTTGFIVFLAAILAVTLGLLAAAGRRRPIGNWPWGGPTTALGVLAFDIVVWRLFTVPEGQGLDVGIFFGLAAAAGIAAGGYLTLREGGIDLLAGSGSSATTRRRPAATKQAAKKKAAAKRPTRSSRKPAASRRSAR